MERLKQIKDYLVTSGGFKEEDIACHVSESDSLPVEAQTETGIHLFDDKYDAVIFIEAVTAARYKNLKLLLYEWFRENKDKDEEYKLSADGITDQWSLVTITMTLVESIHIVPDLEGNIERDESFYSESEPPIPFGI